MILSRIFILTLLPVFVLSCGRSNSSVTTDTQTTENIQAETVLDIELSVLDSPQAVDTLAIGRLNEGELVVFELGMVNDTDQPAVITNIDLTCGCINMDYPKKPLMPEQSSVISLAFDSRGQRGTVHKTVLIYTTAAESPFKLVVTADVR